MPDMKTAGYGKDAPWKSPLDFPTSLGNPAKAAGFPLSAQPLLLLLTKNMTTTDRVTFPFEATRPGVLIVARHRPYWWRNHLREKARKMVAKGASGVAGSGLFAETDCAAAIMVSEG
jgi:hypothetical protein